MMVRELDSLVQISPFNLSLSITIVCQSIVSDVDTLVFSVVSAPSRGSPGPLGHRLMAKLSGSRC